MPRLDASIVGSCRNETLGNQQQEAEQFLRPKQAVPQEWKPWAGSCTAINLHIRFRTVFSRRCDSSTLLILNKFRCWSSGSNFICTTFSLQSFVPMNHPFFSSAQPRNLVSAVSATDPTGAVNIMFIRSLDGWAWSWQQHLGSQNVSEIENCAVSMFPKFV